MVKKHQHQSRDEKMKAWRSSIRHATCVRYHPEARDMILEVVRESGRKDIRLVEDPELREGNVTMVDEGVALGRTMGERPHSPNAYV